MHAVGELAHRPHNGGSMVDETAPNDQLREDVARIHGGGQRAAGASGLEPAQQPHQMSLHMERFEWRRLLR